MSRLEKLIGSCKLLVYYVIILSMKQKLSPTARRAKAIRDKKAAMTPDRRAKKAENQVKRREAIKAGKDIKGKDYDDRYIEAAKNNTALKKLGEDQDVADAVFFLASDRAKYITGQTLYLDGGYRI